MSSEPSVSRARKTTLWVFIDLEKEVRTEKVQVELGEKAKNVGKNNDLDAFNKGKGKGKNDGKCNTCGGDGHYMRDCPTTPTSGTSECHGCNGKGHYKAQCPTANPELKGKGKGKSGKDGGGWTTKGYGGYKGGGNKGGYKGGKGYGGKGYGGKGKGKNSLYEMNLMTDPSQGQGNGWGGNDDGWGGNAYGPWAAQGDGWNNGMSSLSTWRTLACLTAVEVTTSNSFSKIAEQDTEYPDADVSVAGQINVPISDFIVPSRRQLRRIKDSGKNTTRFMAKSCKCQEPLCT